MLMDAKILLSQNIYNTSHYNTSTTSRNAIQNLSASSSEKNVGTRNLLEKVGHKPSFIIICRAACVLNFCLPQGFSGSCM